MASGSASKPNCAAWSPAEMLRACLPALLMLGLALPCAAQTRGTVEARFRHLDRDNDQQLSLEEFRAGLDPARQPVVYQRLPAQFRNFDRDHSEFLEAGEFADLPAIRHGGESAPSFASVDTSKDSRIDFKEYVALMAKLSASR